MGAEPGVDARSVERVVAPGQGSELVAGLELRQADGALRRIAGDVDGDGGVRKGGEGGEEGWVQAVFGDSGGRELVTAAETVTATAGIGVEEDDGADDGEEHEDGA